MMARTIFLFSVLIFLILACNRQRKDLLFFTKMQTPKKFELQGDSQNVYGLDSILVSPFGEIIEGKRYWKLSTPVNALFNIAGYMRIIENKIFIRVRDNSGQFQSEQLLFDFKNSTKKIVSLSYVRNGIDYYIHLANEKSYFDNQIKDTITVFRTQVENKGFSVAKEFLLHVNLKIGITSVIYLKVSDNCICNFELIPIPKITKEPLYNKGYPIQ